MCSFIQEIFASKSIQTQNEMKRKLLNVQFQTISNCEKIQVYERNLNRQFANANANEIALFVYMQSTTCYLSVRQLYLRAIYAFVYFNLFLLVKDLLFPVANDKINQHFPSVFVTRILSVQCHIICTFTMPCTNEIKLMNAKRSCISSPFCD